MLILLSFSILIAMLAIWAIGGGPERFHRKLSQVAFAPMTYMGVLFCACPAAFKILSSLFNSMTSFTDGLSETGSRSGITFQIGHMADWLVPTMFFVGVTLFALSFFYPVFNHMKKRP